MVGGKSLQPHNTANNNHVETVCRWSVAWHCKDTTATKQTSDYRTQPQRPINARKINGKIERNGGKAKTKEINKIETDKQEPNKQIDKEVKQMDEADNGRKRRRTQKKRKRVNGKSTHEMIMQIKKIKMEAEKVQSMKCF